ncbi:uncharacterized protein BDV17DRAFT_211954 [Aspergillus undulatus]|uniref:uncharacterized protein n=1 Tax=Aspergillus undulatus TaxID=1810928 RepID=UPI003CCE0D94
MDMMDNPTLLNTLLAWHARPLLFAVNAFTIASMIITTTAASTLDMGFGLGLNWSRDDSTMADLPSRPECSGDSKCRCGDYEYCCNISGRWKYVVFGSVRCVSIRFGGVCRLHLLH